jgi:hypothetical protein
MVHALLEYYCQSAYCITSTLNVNQVMLASRHCSSKRLPTRPQVFPKAAVHLSRLSPSTYHKSPQLIGEEPENIDSSDNLGHLISTIS